MPHEKLSQQKEGLRLTWRKLEPFSDALLFLYILVLVREYFWWVTNNNSVAWIASTIVAGIVLWLYINNKSNAAHEPVGIPFWLLVVVPLFLIYSMRAAFPDVSFDVLNYRLLHGERALRGFLYLPGDFFPTPAPYNPAPDMVTGILRHALGYRLGTIVNLLAMIWTAQIVDKLLRPFLKNAGVRAGAVLLAMFAEHLLFEINNYMVDLLVVPLLFEAAYLAVHLEEAETERRTLVNIALLLGICVAFKLTNCALALPIVLLCAYRVVLKQSSAENNLSKRMGQLALTTFCCAVAFILPIVPFSAFLYRETGSIVFPVLNGVMKSAYWPPNSIWDPRWGPSVLWEKFVWPILIMWQPQRLSELAIYTGRISLGFVISIVGFLLAGRDRKLRELCFLTFATSLLWSATTGYIRYAFYLEVMAAVIVIAVAARLAKLSGRLRLPSLIAAGLLCAGLLVQSGFAAFFIAHHEWGGRPTFIMDPGPYADEAHYFFRDRSLTQFLSPETKGKFDDVEVWIVSGIKTASLEGLLQPRAPMIGINNGEYFASAAGRARFTNAVKQASGKRMYSLAFSEDLGVVKGTLRQKGLEPQEAVPLQIPWFSPRTSLGLVLIRVEPSAKNVSDGSRDGFPNDGVYNAIISVAARPDVMNAGESQTIAVKVINKGSFVWPSHSAQRWANIVTAGDRWLSPDGFAVVNDLDGRAPLPNDIKPGDQVELLLKVTAPQTAGEYVLEIDMVHEGVTWFNQHGSVTLRWPVKVIKPAL